MDSTADTINNNHPIDKSIHQLHEITTRQQTAINSIQATLATQQKDIAAIKTTISDMRNSINHIIHSLSDLTTKLGLQITLPPFLPISSAPLTLLPTTVSITAAPPLPKPDAPTPISTVAAPFLHQPSLSTLVPSFPIKKYDPIHQLLKSFSDSHINFLVNSLNILHTISRKQQLKIALNFFDQCRLFGTQMPIECIALFGKKYRKDETPSSIKILREHKIFVFDPGGIFNVQCIFEVRSKYDDAHLTTLRTRSVSERVVMMQHTIGLVLRTSLWIDYLGCNLLVDLPE